MRELKFRAWNQRLNTMYEIYNIDFDTGIASCRNLEASSTHDFGFMDLWIEQFTCVRADGVDIYAGDLMRIPARNDFENTTYNCFEVFYHDNECIGGQNIGFCMNRMHPQGASAGGHGYKFTPESIRENGFVVIGNIHENPELVNGR